MTVRPQLKTRTALRQRLGLRPREANPRLRAVPVSSETPRVTAMPEAPAGRGRRHGGPCQDKALYACGCGYSFSAAVSTSVACPHCGSTQAW